MKGNMRRCSKARSQVRTVLIAMQNFQFCAATNTGYAMFKRQSMFDFTCNWSCHTCELGTLKGILLRSCLWCPEAEGSRVAQLRRMESAARPTASVNDPPTHTDCGEHGKDECKSPNT